MTLGLALGQELADVQCSRSEQVLERVDGAWSYRDPAIPVVIEPALQVVRRIPTEHFDSLKGTWEEVIQLATDSAPLEAGGSTRLEARFICTDTSLKGDTMKKYIAEAEVSLGLTICDAKGGWRLIRRGGGRGTPPGPGEITRVDLLTRDGRLIAANVRRGPSPTRLGAPANPYGDPTLGLRLDPLPSASTTLRGRQITKSIRYDITLLEGGVALPDAPHHKALAFVCRGIDGRGVP